MKSFDPSQCLVLIVDDISQNLQVLGSILDKSGYNTTLATSGQQALERVKTIKPDLILLDLMMPVMNGLEVCQILRSQPDTEDIPIIMLTASNESQHLVSAFKAGAVDYLTKPYRLPELLLRLQTHLELKLSKEELKKALHQLEKLAITDALTGIPNRRYLFDIATKEVARAQRFSYPLSLLMLDIDYFKKVNDTYGHPVGDEVIKAVANNLARSLRENDCLARFGGEEFVVILPDTNTEGAVIVAERLRKMIAELGLLVQDKRLKVTLSIGIATLKAQEQNLNELLKRCDDALLEAKRSGRNCYRVHQENLQYNQEAS